MPIPKLCGNNPDPFLICNEKLVFRVTGWDTVHNTNEVYPPCQSTAMLLVRHLDSPEGKDLGVGNRWDYGLICFHGVVGITFALHAKGPQFKLGGNNRSYLYDLQRKLPHQNNKIHQIQLPVRVSNPCHPRNRLRYCLLYKRGIWVSSEAICQILSVRWLDLMRKRSHLFPQWSGYHMIRTHERSPVQNCVVTNVPSFLIGEEKLHEENN